jgi:pyruvate, water dikinase
MSSLHEKVISSGEVNLDRLLQGLRAGDNVVWQMDRLDEYSYFTATFARQAIDDGAVCIYFRFAPHPPVLQTQPGLFIIEVDPTPGFDYFSGKVHEIIEKQGREARFIFDNLSSLVTEWATDELLANFYQVTCPFIFDQDDLAFFALTRGRHDYNTIARIRDTTQILIDVYQLQNTTYIHPLKVWDRYTPQMFLPHQVEETGWTPIFQSNTAASVLSASRKHPVYDMMDSSAPWTSVHRKLLQYKESSTDTPSLSPEVAALKQEMSRMILGNHDELNRLSDKYLSVDDLLNIRDRLIGTGQIGGKAAGMLIARRVLLKDKKSTDYSNILEEHDSFFIGSDVFFTYLVNNNLFRLRLNVSKNPILTREEFTKIEKAFLAGQFPRETLEQFRDMLDYYGQAPIIVRSSSLLEDSFNNAFAGKYRSEFCANQGSPDQRLEAFLEAIKLVYASSLNPDVLSYRKRYGLSEGDEQMAILVQRVSGTPFRKSFFPSLAGVAFSRNLFSWTDRIDPAKGMVRLVFGLGTRAVNRVGNDYPRMVAVSHPGLRPEIGSRIEKYSQKYIDLMDLEANEFATKTINEVVSRGDYPHMELLFSSLAEGYLHDLSPLEKPGKNIVLTFDNLIQHTAFVRTIGEILSKLEKAWGQPIDIEFTAHIGPRNEITLNLLQCRALKLPKTTSQPVIIPARIKTERVLFRSNRAISAGGVDKIRYLVYIDPKAYSAIESVNRKKSLGRIIGDLNRYFANCGEKYILLGPGRWGSNNIELGINVNYGDINNTAVLVEIAQENKGYTPEVSFGTHFFLDLVEAEIIYIPVYPDEERGNFNTTFFENGANIFCDLLPDSPEFKNIISVIDVSSITGVSHAAVSVDPRTRQAICFLK